MSEILTAINKNLGLILTGVVIMVTIVEKWKKYHLNHLQGYLNI